MQDTAKNQSKTGPQVQRYISFAHIVAVTSTLGMGAFYFGYSVGYFSSIDFDTIMNIYSIKWQRSTAQGFLTGCLPIGGGIGALSSNILIQRFSRRRFILIVNCVAFLAGLLLYVQNVYSLLLVRMIQGVCSGCYSTIIPVIIKQLSPTEISGSLGAFNYVFISFGVFFSFCFKYVLEAIADDPNGEKVWWMVFGFSLLTVLIQTVLLLFVFPFQTPKYLLLCEKRQQAIKILKEFYKEQFVQQVLQEKLLDIGKSKNQHLNQNNSSVITSENNDVETNEKDQMLIKLRRNNKIAIAVALHLAFLQQMSGVNAVIAYGGQIAGYAVPSLKSIFPVIVNLQKCIGPLVVSYLLTKFGRKPVLVIGTLVASITTISIAIGFFIRSNYVDVGNVMILSGLVLFMANFGISLGPVMWLYIPEIVQPNIVPFSTGLNWTGTSLVVLLFPIIKKGLPDENPGYLFCFFGIWCLISVVINMKLMVETKGRNQKQIYEEYENMNFLH